jgi:hypothetical protein
MLIRAADLKADLWASRFRQSKRKCRVDSSASLQLHNGDWPCRYGEDDS